MKFKAVIVLSIVLFTACKKEEEVSLAPVIEFVSLSSSSVVELQDELLLKINYSDDNGDLGENVADVKNLFVHDSRTNITFEYRIKQLAPDEANIPIQGTLEVVIEPLVISDGSSAESGVFTIHVIDRDGNESNKVLSSVFEVVN